MPRLKSHGHVTTLPTVRLFQTRKWRRFGFSLCFFGWVIRLEQRFEEVHRKFLPRNTIVQLSTTYSALSAAVYRQTTAWCQYRLIPCLKKLGFALNSSTCFIRCVLRLNDTPYSESVLDKLTTMNLPARNTLVVQLLALYTDPESHNAQC